jgi:hypothetical protein
VDHAIHHRLIAGLDPAAHPVDVVGSARHGFLATGNDAVGVTGLDVL